MNTQLGIEFKKFRVKVGIALAVISLGCAVGIYQGRTAGEDAQSAADKAHRAIVRVDTDTKKRLNESCTQRERKWIADIHSVRITEFYLSHLKSTEVNSSLNQLIVSEWPRSYKDYQFDKPLSACKESGIGLNKSIKDLPPYKDFSYLLILKK